VGSSPTSHPKAVSESLLLLFLTAKFMKIRILMAALAALMLSACVNEGQLQTGDLLFVGYPKGTLDGGLAGAIASSTAVEEGLDFVHTAIIDMDGDTPYVIDATIKYGVDRHPLSTLVEQFKLQDGSAPSLVVMRLKDNGKALEFVENAKAYIGESYDAAFMAGNGKHYCTELVYDSYVDGGEHLFDTVPMNFKGPDGEFPRYWVELFELIGYPIPQGEPGTNPQQMSESDCLVVVNY